MTAAERAAADFGAAHPSMGLAVEELPGELVIRATGTLDSDVAAAFREAAIAAMAAAGRKERYIVDLGGLLYISSTGIGALTLLLTEARKRGSELLLRAVPRNVRNVIEAMGFAPYFRFAGEGA